MSRKSLKQWLTDANGWKRIWFACSVVCVLYFVIFYPIAEYGNGKSFRYERLWAAEREIKNPLCAPYMTNDFLKLSEPQYSTDGSTCYHIYSHRQYSDDKKPITITSYQQDFNDKERNMWLMLVAMGFFIGIVLSLFVFGLGSVTAWIVRGFRKIEE